MTELTEAPKKRVAKPRAIFRTPDGKPINYKSLSKFEKDVIKFYTGSTPEKNTEIVTVEDANNPLRDIRLTPQPQSPICGACKLDQTGCKTPYMDYVGTEHPVVTILTESISLKEDDRGSFGSAGINGWLAALIHKLHEHHGVSLDEIRFVPITRCASRDGKLPNYKTKGNWCRHYAIQDLIDHPPKVVIPVGTQVLGLLSHKSNAGDWSGRLLTWRGWPDDWLTDKDFVLDRPDPLDETKFVRGHPLHGPPPPENMKIPMVPLQNPRYIMAAQNEIVMKAWIEDLLYALQVGKQVIPPPSYDRKWYVISENPDEVIETLERAIAFAEADPDFLLTFDTETTGLKPWAHFKRIDAARNMTTGMLPGSPALKEESQNEHEIIRSKDPSIVFMMFRWTNTETGKPESIGFPWDYDTSKLKPHLSRIAPYVIRLLASSNTTGHNLNFDDLFTIATVGRKENEHIPFNQDGSWNEDWLMLQERINLIAEAAKFDTWHMSFALMQRRGSLGLEILAYDYVPDLAGYEEDMTLLITLYGDAMNPANNKGGHYANCPKELWDTHLRPYVMGDVEVTHQARELLAARLDRTKVYKIPLAKPREPGTFRFYQCPNRSWVYNNIMSPASRTLTKMMARGMHIDPEKLEELEQEYPAMVDAARESLRKVDPAIEGWCQKMEQESEKKRAEHTDGTASDSWELDLENKAQLKELLFGILNCPIRRFTKKGRSLYGDDPADWEDLTKEEKREYAAVDKYTLNHLAVDHPNLRPLQDYRKKFKLYSTYIRPMRNMMSGLDKKQRNKDPHLCVDQCIHASFLLTGTRSGRLSSRDPNLQQLPNEGLVKMLFTSRFKDKGCIYAADLSQIELRLMAVACGDRSMVQAYMDDVDIHSLTASKIFKVPYETFTKKHMEDLQKKGKGDEAKKRELERKIAKTTNFLTGYGGGAFGLQNVLANNEVYLSIEECEDIILSFFDAYPALKLFLGIYKNFIEQNGVAVSMFGRVRHFEEVYSEDRELSSKALRAGCNHLIQSTASDMMLICLTTIEDMMRQAELRSLLVSTVHDSLVIDAVREELPEVHAIVNGVMNNIPEVIEARFPGFDTSWMYVPFAGDSEVGLNYLDTNKISGENPDWDLLLQPKKKG